MVQATSTLYRAPKLLVAGEVGTVKLHAPMTALDKITLGGPRLYPDVPSAEPRPVAFRQQREDDQQQIGPTRVRQFFEAFIASRRSGPGRTASSHGAAHRCR